ncbi:energy transducer TonB [Dokdonella fugitiva]|uniref:Protein TonB n=1 Tax=Dokdonella fugitiva TaxID=328517 RepID=A0A4R2HZU4_9GAMM|nr:energy transducer TonB [Dokdonella fugitiva]TCO36856.1 protein TonB [Dokdonella fugitiva]
MRNPIGEGVSTPRSVAASGKAMPRVRGLALPQIIVIVLGLALLAVAAWWFLGSGGTTVTSTATAPTQAAAPGENSAPNAEPASADLSVDQLYKEARAAMSENRMVTPAGKNALEYYLRIVAKQPDDNGAKDALRELFPFATAGVEDQINQGNFDEANRIMALLATADPSNYTLTILRSKLDLKKKQADRDLAQKAAQEAAAAAAATRTAQGGTAPGASEAGATPATAPASTAATGAETSAAPASTPTEVAKATPPPSAAPTPAPPAPVGETRDVRVVTPPRPTYPPAAVRNRQDGWVEVEFTVAADGSVQNAHVTASEPSRVFDREAVRAVQQAKFEPKLENGQAVASTLRRRIEFKLGN